ncbi:MAG: phage head-tail connector protein [Chloroflexota bacterium]
MPIGVKLVTPPAVEPVSLTEAKARLKVTTDAEDDDLTALIAECRAQAEDECGRAFVTQTLSLYLDRFPRGAAAIELPRPPLQSVTWVKYYDAAGDLQTMDAAGYHVAIGGEPGRIVPTADSGYWPVTEAGRPEAVEVRYVAGYGLAAAVPRQATAAILALIADRNANPDGGDRAIPPAARRQLDALDVRAFGYDVPAMRGGD